MRSLLRLRTQRLGGEAEVLVDPQSSCVLRMQVLLGSSMGLPPLPYKMVRFREKSYAFGRNLSQKRPTVVPGPVRKERSDSSRRHVSAAHSPLPALSLAVPASLRWPEGRASPPPSEGRRSRARLRRARNSWICGLMAVGHRLQSKSRLATTRENGSGRARSSSTWWADAAKFGGSQSPISAAADRPLGNSVGAIESVAARPAPRWGHDARGLTPNG